MQLMAHRAPQVCRHPLAAAEAVLEASLAQLSFLSFGLGDGKGPASHALCLPQVGFLAGGSYFCTSFPGFAAVNSPLSGVMA